jgi:hypothetical protein
MPRINEPTLEEHRRKTLNALLDCAEDIIRYQGDKALTPAAVSEGAGIARNSIYRYVRNMDDLRRMLLMRHLPEWERSLRDGLEGVSDPVDIIGVWVRINIEQASIHGHGWMTKMHVSDTSGTAATCPHASANTGNVGSSGISVSSHMLSSDSSTSSTQLLDSARISPSSSATSSSMPSSTAPEPSFDTTKDSNGKPNFHTVIAQPILNAWYQLAPSSAHIGTALTRGLVASGMHLLENAQDDTESDRIIMQTEIAARAIALALQVQTQEE